MRNSIATYKESLSRIASEVLDDEEELEIPQHRGAAGEDSPASGRRFSRRRSSRFSSPIGSAIANGPDSVPLDEIAKYKADIQKLQASEAEIKAISFNYAAILKEKEDQLSKLREENGSLRRNLEAKNALGHAPKDESLKTLSNSSHVFKSTADQSPIRRQRHSGQENSHSPGNNSPKGNASKQDVYSNGGMQPNQIDTMQRKRELKFANLQGNGKEYPDLLEENRSLAAVQASLESEIKQLKAQLDSEHENATIMKQKLREEHQLNESSLRELHDLKIDKEKTSVVMKELHQELNEKISELSRLQTKLSRRDIGEESNESLESLKNAIRTLEKENAKLKVEKNELEANLQLSMTSASQKNDADDLDSQKRKSINSHEVTEEMALSIRKLEETLKDTCKERDKTLQELARLKQHLLEKELEDSDKMDEDSKIIEDLRANCEYQRAHILQLEKALKQEMSKKEEIKKIKSDELHKSNEIINDLKQKLANCMSIVESKDIELLNLQTALGQYYAESEAKERLGRDLAVAREESTKLSESLKAANQGLEMSNREKEEIAAKLTQAERMLSESKHSIQKLEEENSKLRRALEQSMTRLNRMSLDSDNYVDRRIVIKLLVTYFQRNHSKEVLDLMVRMLGFSEEDKQRMGFAQHSSGKGVVRGVLGLPGRLVGGILGGSSPETSSNVPSENQVLFGRCLPDPAEFAGERVLGGGREGTRAGDGRIRGPIPEGREEVLFFLPSGIKPQPRHCSCSFLRFLPSSCHPVLSSHLSHRIRWDFPKQALHRKYSRLIILKSIGSFSFHALTSAEYYELLFYGFKWVGSAAVLDNLDISLGIVVTPGCMVVKLSRHKDKYPCLYLHAMRFNQVD